MDNTEVTYQSIFSEIGKMMDAAAVGDKFGALNAYDRSRLLCNLMDNVDCSIPQLCDSIFNRAHDKMVMDGVVW